MAASPTGAALDEEGSAMAGWLAGAGLILLVVVVGAVLWVRFHGL